MADGMTGSVFGGGSALEGMLLGILTGSRNFDNNGHGFGCDAQAELSRQIAEASAGIIQATQSQNIAGITATNAAAQAAQAIASETRSDVNRIEGAIELAQALSEARLAGAIERNGGDTRTSVERNGGDTRTSVERNASEIRQNVSDGNAEMRRDIADAQSVLHSTLEARTTELRMNMTQNFAQTLLEVERAKFLVTEAKCALERQASDNLNQIQLEAARNVAAVQLDAERNKASIMKQMEECCCEVKETVREEGGRTRALIEKNEVDRLRESLEQARRETDYHRHNESIRVSVQQFVNSQNRTGTTPATPVA